MKEFIMHTKQAYLLIRFVMNFKRISTDFNVVIMFGVGYVKG